MSIKEMFKERLSLMMEAERLFPFLAMVMATICLFININGQPIADFQAWSMFVGLNVLGGSAGAFLKKKFIDQRTETQTVTESHDSTSSEQTTTTQTLPSKP